MPKTYGFDDTFVTLQTAVRTRHKVKIAYDSFFEKQLIETQLSPYHLHFARRAWYVIGHSQMHNEIRIFKLTRIKKLDSLYIFDKPFRIDDYLGRAWSILPEGKIHNVSLRFSKLVAKNVAEVLWHPTQKLTWHKDGAMTFDAQVDGTASHASSYKPQRGDMKKPGASPRVTRFKIYFSPERA